MPGAAGVPPEKGPGSGVETRRMPTTTAPRLRECFPTLADATYLVSHSMGAAPLAARAALLDYWQAWEREGPSAWNAWLPGIEAVADNLGRIFGAPPGSVSLTPNVSLAMAAIASSLELTSDRNEIVLEELQFPSVSYVWKAWERFGARLVVVPSHDRRSMSTDRLCSAIGERTAAVVLSHAAYQSGALIDVPAVSARCGETGALFVLDTYQTTGVVPYDATALGVDVMTGGSHKWLCGGPGCGYVYVRPALRDRLAPAVTGWMGHAEPFAFEPAPIRLAAGAARWNTGTPTIPGYLAAAAGHAAILAVGVAAIRDHNVRQTTALAEGALARGFSVATPLEPARRTGWIGMDFTGAERASEALAARRIFVDYRPGCGIRVGPHFYTSDEEIVAFFDAVDEIRR